MSSRSATGGCLADMFTVILFVLFLTLVLSDIYMFGVSFMFFCGPGHVVYSII